MIKKNKLILYHSICPLLLGGLIYILFRTKTLIMFQWFSILRLDSFLLNVRENVSVFKNYLPLWVYYSLPDGLWIYSFTSTLLIHWHDNIEFGKYWLLIPFTLGIGVEILQGLDLFQGTFDWVDLFLSTLGFLTSILIIKVNVLKYEK